MKYLTIETKFASVTEEQCAALLMETMPQFMRRLRLLLHRDSIGDLSYQELRILSYIKKNDKPSISSVAEELCTSMPMASKQVEQLVQRKLLRRQTDKEDRRRVTLELTPSGNVIFSAAQQAAKQHMLELLEGFSEEERSIIGSALELLKKKLVPSIEPEPK
jgi:DNA-binding MarR family transcriptional regulator